MAAILALIASLRQEESCDFRGWSIYPAFGMSSAMENVDGNWLRARLTGQHGELRQIAAAVGLEPDKITKILKGQRQIKGTEVPRFLHYFNEVLPRYEAFREEAGRFQEDHIQPTLSDPALVTAIAPTVRRPIVYIAGRNYSAAGILDGDMLVADSDDHDSDGLVLASSWNSDGSSETFLRRKVGTDLLSLDPLDQTPVMKLTDSPGLAVLGVVATLLRKHVMRRR
jgi:hypothetical protein